MYICGAHVWFAYAAHVSKWTLWISEQSAGGTWQKVVDIDEPGWPRSHWVFDDAKAYISAAMGIKNTAVHTLEDVEWLDGLEDPGGVGSTYSWEDELWARQELYDNPIKNTVHEFNCTIAKRAQVVVHHTTSDLFAISEIELMGYPMTGNGSASPCPLTCRHGGSCLADTQLTCSCPAEWGWAGDQCRVCNRSRAISGPSHYETFDVDIEAPVWPTIYDAYRQASTRNGGNSIVLSR